MNILVIGSGGREHALIKSIKKNPSVETVYALPGNGGIAKDAVCVDIKADEFEKIVDFAVKEKIDFAVVAPDDPLVGGLVDLLNEKGISCFGPDKKAAIIEGSKVFSKNLMKKYKIPTAEYAVFENSADALSYLENVSFPTVIKADGLALGKGVVIAENLSEAQNAVRSIMEDKVFGKSGNEIVIEEYLEGPEVSVLAFTDGKTVVPMVSSMDHKRALDGDRGPNTGGMGTIAPNPYYTEEIARECTEKIFLPTICAMRSEGRPFMGCLYFGLMLTEKGPKVIEYNCRFGDPETQVVLPLLKTDLLEILLAVSQGRLADMKIEFEDGACCCVVLASNGYPAKYETGFPITLPEVLSEGEEIFVSGAKEKDGRLVSAGGRVLGACAKGKDLKEAIENAYRLSDRISFENAYKRGDIGKRALSALQK